jgi:2,4-dienoyl-CoA reductase-like NADH-dependent reductase (Old Yellow Enzyme family)
VGPSAVPFGDWPTPTELSIDEIHGPVRSFADAARRAPGAGDRVPGGWDVGETVELARRLASHGVDLIDGTSGGLVPGARIEVEPGSQVPFARTVREGGGAAAVGRRVDRRAGAGRPDPRHIGVQRRQ